MPAAAEIPAPIAYIKVVAVKKLVVGSVSHAAGSSSAVSTGVSRDVLPVGLARKGGPNNPAAVLFTECRGRPARLL